MRRAGKHAAPARAPRALAAVAAFAVLPMVSGSAAVFTDAAPTVASVLSVVAPTPTNATVINFAGLDGYPIFHRANGTCPAPWVREVRMSDQMVAWGATWNGWKDWVAGDGDPGWSPWQASHLESVGPAYTFRVRYEVRCALAGWFGPSVSVGPTDAVYRHS